MATVAVAGAAISIGDTDGRRTVELVRWSAHFCAFDTLAGYDTR